MRGEPSSSWSVFFPNLPISPISLSPHRLSVAPSFALLSAGTGGAVTADAEASTLPLLLLRRW
jgi:hypothetical protein